MNKPKREITRREVKSSQIKSIGYDNESSTLEVEFTSKGNPIWHYQPITAEGYHALLNAESIGKYFIANVRDNTLVTAIKLE
jgi:hypothetical protein